MLPNVNLIELLIITYHLQTAHHKKTNQKVDEQNNHQKTDSQNSKTKNMNKKSWTELCAINSVNHRHKKLFLTWLKEAISQVKDEFSFHDNDNRSKWKPKDWRDNMIKGNPVITNEIYDHLDQLLMDSFTETGELIASVGYDHYGPSHSGWNGVFEICGVYILHGSDYKEGPTLEKDEMLGFLNTENEEHDVYWSEYAN
jgi:hypothetical protein